MIIKRYPSGEWYALLCVGREASVMEKVMRRFVGIDMGLRFFLTDAEKREIENPRFYERTLERIKIEQKRLSKKKRGSKNWIKQLLRLNIYQKLMNQRDDFLHKLEGLSFDDPYRHFILANILCAGLGQSLEPVKRGPLLLVAAEAVISGQVPSVKQETPSVRAG